MQSLSSGAGNGSKEHDLEEIFFIRTVSSSSVMGESSVSYLSAVLSWKILEFEFESCGVCVESSCCRIVSILSEKNSKN